MEIIRISSTKRTEIIDITGEIRAIVRNAKVKSGIVVVYVPHTTAAVTINENADPSVKKDIINTLSKIIPESDLYAHLEGNADAHIKASIMGSSRVVIIEDGEIQLGTWQGIFFVEFDGPRRREVFVEIIPKTLQAP
jgi:secondary thiamine-phosphate synthase enzyme